MMLGGTMAKTTDCASTVFKSVASATKLTTNPTPAVQPPLGGLAGAVVSVPSTSAARIWLFARLGF